MLSVAKGRSLHGKHGMSVHVKRSRSPSPNSVSVWQLLTTLISRVKRSFLFSWMCDRSCADNLFAHIGRIMWHHLLSLPSRYIQSVLPTKEELSRVKSLPLDLSQKWSKQGDKWKIHWTDISPSIGASCQELTTKDGKGSCGRCKCLDSGLNCGALCSSSCET